MRVLERGARGCAVVLEEQDVAEAQVLAEVEDARPEGPEDARSSSASERSFSAPVVIAASR